MIELSIGRNKIEYQKDCGQEEGFKVRSSSSRSRRRYSSTTLTPGTDI